MKTKLLLLLLLLNFSMHSQTNLVSNPGFENWTGANPVNWTASNSVTSSADASTGQYSAKLSYTTLSPKVTTQVALKAGITYTVKFKYKYLSSNYGGTHPIALKIFQNGSAVTLTKNVFASNNLWTEKEDTFTPDMDLSYDLSVSTFSIDSEPFDVLIDDIQVYDPNEPKYTLIPDSNFEKKLISLGIDSGIPDGKVETSKIESVTSLDISYSNIKNITGIEDFKNLVSLVCNDNEIMVLNISKNTKLEYLDCSSTMVYLLDFSNNPELKDINVSKNPYVTKIDVSNNLKLTSLNCSTTSISRLDVSKNTKLSALNCKQVYIIDLDLSYNTALTSLDCSDNYNSLTTLNLKNGNNSNFIPANSNFTNNAYLTCITVDSQSYSNDHWSSLKDSSASFNTSCLDGPYTLIPDENFEKALIKAGVDYRDLDGKVLTANILLVNGINLSGANINDLTGIEGFLNLMTLNCKTNNLTNLDLSQNINLQSVNCSENKLISLNLTNKPDFTTLTSTSNPNLTCIKVDDPAYSQTNWTGAKDAVAAYSTSCNLGTQDSVFSYAVLSPNPTKGEVTINNVSLEKANVYNTLGQLVKSFTLNSSNINSNINLSGLPKGIYYIYLINGDAASAKKIIIE